jgi:hypothetical protein
MGAGGMEVQRKQTWVWVLLAAAWAQAVLAAPELNHASPENTARQYSENREPCTRYDENRQAFFGDLHVHTRYSLDASTQGTQTTPDQAYRFARGQKIGIQPWSESGAAMRSLQLRRPLDFAMISDHAELIGEVQMCNTPDMEGYGSWQCMLYRYFPRGAFYLFNYMATMQATHLGMCGDDGELCRAASLAPWEEMQDAAEQHYDRSSDCRFTAFVGYEWTGMQSDSGGNLHRNIVFRNDNVPHLPASFIDTPQAKKLWQSLGSECNDKEGSCDSLVIPHNSNLSAGYMFSGLADDGTAMTREYAELRNRYEPLAEIMQHKGASECFYEAGVTRDELCAFEQQPIDNIAGFDSVPKPTTGFLRSVLSQGMALEQTLGVNPYKYGIIASTDTHLGTPGAAEKDKFLGHGGAGVPARDEVPPGLPDKLEYNPGGLAVVWAAENSRDALFDAMRRKEVYGTSGPRIESRLFGGWNFSDNLCADPDLLTEAYATGVPMGSDLPPASAAAQAPKFVVFASQDAGVEGFPGTALQRIQIIKGWIDQTGEHRERVVDVAGDASNGASVDIHSCETRGSGFASLCAVWSGDTFKPEEQAYYYSRVVENPSCRWSQRICNSHAVDCSNPDSIGEGLEGCCAEEHRPVIQERAWSSPIWYRPAG